MKAIICMAGSGKRLNIGDNKAFLLLNNKYLFLYSLEILLNYVSHIYLVIREEDLPRVKPYLSDKVSYVLGGKEREDSVYNAMVMVDKEDKVLIHDAARPFINKEVLEQIIKYSKDYDLVLPYLPLKYTIYNINPISILNRNDYILAQTPQVVLASDFIWCYQKALKDNFKATDDISLVLKYLNKEVKLIEDDEKNIKITTNVDLEIAKYYISN